MCCMRICSGIYVFGWNVCKYDMDSTFLDGLYASRSEAPKLRSSEAPKLRSYEATKLRRYEARKLPSSEAPKLRRPDAPKLRGPSFDKLGFVLLASAKCTVQLACANIHFCEFKCRSCCFGSTLTHAWAPISFVEVVALSVRSISWFTISPSKWC